MGGHLTWTDKPEPVLLPSHRCGGVCALWWPDPNGGWISSGARGPGSVEGRWPWAHSLSRGAAGGCTCWQGQTCVWSIREGRRALTGGCPAPRVGLGYQVRRALNSHPAFTDGRSPPQWASCPWGHRQDRVTEPYRIPAPGEFCRGKDNSSGLERNW